ncbi:MAG: twin-arginine translocase subunit TatB [Alphaproteobacteria bacterium]|nr:twin-arginine translocase subunit TatB [Alphaproteobacteria bacterium]
MFDIGWSEMLLCAVVALVVIGPKDLPQALRALGRLLGKARATANEFRGQFDDLMRESELEELRKQADSLRALGHDMSVGLDPTGTQATPAATPLPSPPAPGAPDGKPGGQPT